MFTVDQLRAQLAQLPIHQKYPFFTPYVGEEYLENGIHKKLLIVGESHYLPLTSKVDVIDEGYSKENRLNWYKNPPSVSSLKEEDSYGWLDTKNLGLYGNSTPFMVNIDQALAEVLQKKYPGISGHSQTFKHVAYCNFFVRPSKQKRLGENKDGTPRVGVHPISALQEDKIFANERMLDIIKTITPDVIMLLGVEAYKGTWCAGNKLTLIDIVKAAGLNTKYFYTYHPSYTDSQWNAVKSPSNDSGYFGGLTCHQFFNKMLEKHWLK